MPIKDAVNMKREFKKINEDLLKSNIYGELCKQYRNLYFKFSSLELHKSIDTYSNSALVASTNIERGYINGLVELDRDNLYLINQGLSTKLSSPLPIHINARKVPQKLTFNKAELAVGKREINTGSLRHYFDEENNKEEIYLDIGVPQYVMNNIWETLVEPGEYEVILCICVNIFQCEMEASLRGPLDRQNFFIESNNYYHAYLETIVLKKKVSIAKNEVTANENKVSTSQEEAVENQEEDCDEVSLSQFTNTIFLPSMHVIADDFRHLILVLWAIVAILLISFFV